jgi:hypothetical protein
VLPSDERPRPGKDPRPAALHAEAGALAIAVVWLLLVQLGCVALWDAGWLTRQAALVHWLLVGVLPPALALWRMERAAE